MSKPCFRLTLGAAKKLVKQELGISPSMLMRATDPSAPAIRYEMETGSLLVQVENDWYSHNGLIKLRIYNAGQDIVTYHRPETLAEAVGATDARLREIEAERRREYEDQRQPQPLR